MSETATQPAPAPARERRSIDDWGHPPTVATLPAPEPIIETWHPSRAKLDAMAREAVAAVLEAVGHDAAKCHRSMRRLRSHAALRECGEILGCVWSGIDANPGGWYFADATIDDWREAVARAWDEVSGLGKMKHWAKNAPLFQ
jgi:hypothetical protein